MNMERWQIIEDLFHKVSACNPSKRNALLEALGKEDPKLEQEVRELLLSDQQAEQSAFLHESPLGNCKLSQYRWEQLFEPKES